jgi:hypothetical protein
MKSQIGLGTTKATKVYKGCRSCTVVGTQQSSDAVGCLMVAAINEPSSKDQCLSCVTRTTINISLE